MIIATNIMLMIGSSITLIDNSIVIIFGRFIVGAAAGAYTSFVPKFAAEFAPPEYRGPFGGINQFMCTFGIFFMSALGIPIPNVPSTQLALDSFYVQ